MPIHLENRTSFDTLKNQWKLLHKQKGQRINYHLITILKCTELFCYTKCLVTCCNYYFVSGMYNIRKMATPWHKVFNIYKSYSVQVAKKKEKYHPLKISFFSCYIFYSKIDASIIYNICNLQVTLFWSVNQIGFTITICSLKTQNYVSISTKLSWIYFSMIYYSKCFAKLFWVKIKIIFL